MEKPFPETIVPAEFPELSFLVWNRNPRTPIAAEDVFSLYERNWRFVDMDAMTEVERTLIEALQEKFGQGFRLL